jgi:hypothetical protein
MKLDRYVGEFRFVQVNLSGAGGAIHVSVSFQAPVSKARLHFSWKVMAAWTMSPPVLYEFRIQHLHNESLDNF